MSHFEEKQGDLNLTTDPAKLDLERIHHYLSGQSYWARGMDRDRFERSVQGSLCFGIYSGAEQLAFARVVTDRATFAYLCDVFVLPAHQGRGLGKWLVAAIHRHPELQGLRRWLLATRDAHGLYKQLGWSELASPDRLMELTASPAHP
jgi:GNAT superfamily N-acetyltransferase